MKKIILLVLLLINLDTLAQSDIDFRPFDHNTSVFVEFLGHSATMFSVNYDRIIRENEKAFTNLTIGYGNYATAQMPRTGFNIPISINRTTGKSNHKLEAGLGLSLNKSNYQFTRVLLLTRLGYKYQRRSGGLFFKAAFTPMGTLFYFYGEVNNDGWFKDIDLAYHFIGFSVGYSF